MLVNAEIRADIKDPEKLVEPGRLLVERVCNGVGYLGETFLATRRARALEAAKNIVAQGEIDRSDAQLRAEFRQEREALIQQQNLEAIAIEAAKALPRDAKPESVDDDWLLAWSKRARDVSDGQMRLLWAQLLARETVRPGSVSRRALAFVESLDQRDATAFAVVCQFIVGFGIEVVRTPAVLIWTLRDAPVINAGLSLTVMNDLEALGLLKTNLMSNYMYLVDGTILKGDYFGTPVRLEVQAGQRVNMGCVMLTRLGIEMAAVCQADRNEEFLDYARAKLGTQGKLLD